MKPSYAAFAALLRERGASRYQVSKATGVAASTFYNWERGISCPKSDKLQRIAAYFQVPPSAFFEEGPALLRAVPLFGGGEALAAAGLAADFCLPCEWERPGGVLRGLAFVRQEEPGEGELAAVLIDGRAALMRIYKAEGLALLLSDRPGARPLAFKEGGGAYRVLGKAAAFQCEVE